MLPAITLVGSSKVGEGKKKVLLKYQVIFHLVCID